MLLKKLNVYELKENTTALSSNVHESKKNVISITHTRLTARCPGLPGWASTRKVKPPWILLKQETVSGNGISWAICKSAPHFRQHPTTQFFTGRMPFLPPNQQHQSTEGISIISIITIHRHRSLITLRAACDDPSGGRRPAQIPQLADT